MLTNPTHLDVHLCRLSADKSTLGDPDIETDWSLLEAAAAHSGLHLTWDDLMTLSMSLMMTLTIRVLQGLYLLIEVPHPSHKQVQGTGAVKTF